MASYYYLVATLPMLRYESQSPFDTDSFLEQCKGQVSDRDYQSIVSALSGRSSSHPFLQKWQQFASMVKKELNDQRSKKLDLSAPKYRNDGEKAFRIGEAVRQALSNENALDAELSLLSLKWDYLDEIAALHYFDVEALLAYALKLQLLQRKGLFTKEEGNAEFKRLFSNLQSEIANT
ncbi:MAG: DUF2764 family protein [Spirochaetia bacterium]|jgi:hypothetical protein|nr:DUF2764 family protein [Spirochaetia bacterium]